MERKLATVLFVDLVDSTALVGAVDPEVVRRRVREYFDETSACIEQHGGMVEKFAGDAVMAAFGVPRTHEDDAQRALRAAFAVMDKVRALGLEARIGVEAGEVVVDDTASVDLRDGRGRQPRRAPAAGRPRPGEIVLGPVVRRLAAGSVEVEDAGPIEVKGRAEPLWTWRAIRSLDTPRGVAAAWFIGREQELELLENALARTVRDRRASLVTVFGEPGIGKTRLVTEFVERRRARDRAHRPRAAVRRGHHVLAARLDDQGLGRDQRRRARGGGVREAPALLRERGRRRPARGRARRARRRRGRAHAPAS